MKEEFLYRKANTDDAFEILSVDKSVYNKIDDEPLSIFFIMDSCKIFSDTFFVALNKKQIVGFCIGLSTKSSAQGWISALTVLKEYERRGIGTNLLKKVVEELKSLNCETVGLTAEQDMKTFYENNEFNVVSEVKGYYGKGKDRFVMEMVFTK